MKGKAPAFDGAWLRAVRTHRRLSAQEVGQRAGVTARHIWRLEAGKRLLPVQPPGWQRHREWRLGVRRMPGAGTRERPESDCVPWMVPPVQ